MKRIIFAVFFMALALLVSCSTDVDLFADYKEVPIIYGLLDYNADTNFIKITHAIEGGDNALISANNPDLNNYHEKLDVRITEFRNGDSIRQIVLDTITIHNKQDGLFYAPAQKMYYTTEHLCKNTPGIHYTYRLTVVLPEQTLVTNAAIVGSDRYSIRSTVADFSGGTKNILFQPAENAGVYDATMSFTFLERRTFNSDSVPRTVKWHMGTYFDTDLVQHTYDGAYVIKYHRNDLYEALGNFIGDDTLVPGLRRYLTDYPIEVTITAGGQNLSQYLIYNGTEYTSMNPGNSYSGIDGGYGVFSSKSTRTQKMRLGGTTVPELVNDTKWGFKYIGGDL